VLLIRYVALVSVAVLVCTVSVNRMIIRASGRWHISALTMGICFTSGWGKTHDWKMWDQMKVVDKVDDVCLVRKQSQCQRNVHSAR